MNDIQYIEQFFIEVTRKCNMHCNHCLRGDAQNLNIDFSFIEKALSHVKCIQQITFTGGEPTLNVPAIRHALDICKKNQIAVSCFYIVTNGKKITKSFVQVCMDWFLYCDSCDMYTNREYSAVSLSIDMYHDTINPKEISKLRLFSFFTDKDHTTDWFQYYLLDEGRAKNLHHSRKRNIINCSQPYYIRIEDDGMYVDENNVYISANGDVKTDCNTSYDNDNYTIGNLQQQTLYDILKSYKESDDE